MFGYHKDDKKPEGRMLTRDKYTAHWVKGKGGISMGVMSCRSREASLLPNYIRGKASASVTAGILDQNPGGGRRLPRGERKA